jgi:2,3-bisphosphoglycerate-dependent phosphoglycerate mutase
MHHRYFCNKFKNSFLLIRHGESIWNQDSKFTGWTNIPLTTKGKEDAKNIANTIMRYGLSPNIIFSSVLQRCIETSNIIKEELNMDNNIPLLTSWRLNEKHYGTLEGIPRQYIRKLYGDEFTKMMRSSYNVKPPIINNYKNNIEYNIYRNCYFETIKDGESKKNVLDRLLPYYENDILYTFNENKFPLIVTHKHTARVLMKYLLNISDEDFQYYELPNKKIILVSLDEKLKYKIHYELPYM